MCCSFVKVLTCGCSPSGFGGAVVLSLLSSLVMPLLVRDKASMEAALLVNETVLQLSTDVVLSTEVVLLTRGVFVAGLFRLFRLSPSF